MKQLLVIGRGNWADEMNVYYTGIWNAKDWSNHLSAIEKYFEINDSITVYVGSNEEIEYSSFSEYAQQFKTFPLTEAKARFLKSVGLSSFGQNLVFENYDED
jgi:hypothetical protein